eukprot:gene3247-3761_t
MPAGAPPSVFVDPAGGNDGTGTGTIASPVRTIARGLALVRTKGPAGATRALMLRAGVHYLAATVSLTADDSNLTITAYSGPGGLEEVWVSGGTPVHANWTRAPGWTGNVYVTDVPSGVSQ